MFAVVRTGGKQYRVAPGDKIVVERLDGNAGDRVTLGDVLLAGDGGSLKSTDGLIVAIGDYKEAKKPAPRAETPAAPAKGKVTKGEARPGDEVAGQPTANPAP